MLWRGEHDASGGREKHSLCTVVDLTVINFLNLYINAVNYGHCWPLSLPYNVVLTRYSDSTPRHNAQGDSIKVSYITRRIKSLALILFKFKLNYAFKTV